MSIVRAIPKKLRETQTRRHQKTEKRTNSLTAAGPNYPRKTAKMI